PADVQFAWRGSRHARRWIGGLALSQPGSSVRLSKRNERAKQRLIGEAVVAAVARHSKLMRSRNRVALGRWVEEELRSRNLAIVSRRRAAILKHDQQYVDPGKFDDERVKSVFASVMRFLRGRIGKNQEDLALHAGIDRTFVSQLERAIHAPTL